jgi:hypothetical protein
MTVYWGVPDPATVTGSQAEIALAYRKLHQRISVVAALPLQSRDQLSCKASRGDRRDREDEQPN